MSNWQPIKTAPRDQYIWVYSDNLKWCGLDGMALGYIHSDYNGHKNACSLDGRAGRVVIGKEFPTHWTPLPEPPAHPTEDASAAPSGEKV